MGTTTLTEDLAALRAADDAIAQAKRDRQKAVSRLYERLYALFGNISTISLTDAFGNPRTFVPRYALDLAHGDIGARTAVNEYHDLAERFQRLELANGKVDVAVDDADNTVVFEREDTFRGETDVVRFVCAKELLEMSPDAFHKTLKALVEAAKKEKAAEKLQMQDEAKRRRFEQYQKLKEEFGDE